MCIVFDFAPICTHIVCMIRMEYECILLSPLHNAIMYIEMGGGSFRCVTCVQLISNSGILRTCMTCCRIGDDHRDIRSPLTKYALPISFRWVNACLRHELRQSMLGNQQNGPCGSALDLGNTYDARSHRLAQGMKGACVARVFLCVDKLSRSTKC